MSELISKALATITSPESDSPHGGFQAVLSTPSVDRDGDTLGTDEWVTPLPERIVLDRDHTMSVAGTIGSARPYFDDGGRLCMDAQFASTPEAQQVRSLITEGHINAVSVAFLTGKSKKDGTPRRELLNAGVVAIPSNRDAVILSSKAFAAAQQLNKAAETKVAVGVDPMVQAIHDAAVHLGAVCMPAPDVEPDADDTGTAEGANKTLDPQNENLEGFMERVDSMIKTSGTAGPGTDAGPQDESPADSEAAAQVAPQGPTEAPASEKAADEADVEIRARLLRASLIASELSDA